MVEKTSKVAHIRQLLTDHPDMPVKQLAKKAKSDPSAVYRVRMQMRGLEATTRKSVRKTLDAVAASESATSNGNGKKRPKMCIELHLPEGPANILIRDQEGVLIGTLVLEKDGLSYRRPNQKPTVNGDRKIGWPFLDKIMDLGFVAQ